MKLVLATKNPGKKKEIQILLQDLNIEICTADEIGFTKEIIEDQQTFKGNALKKARELHAVSKDWILADDSGLCIDALDGKPGVYSARWAGEGSSDEQLLAHTLNQLEVSAKKSRNAFFETAIVVISPDGKEKIFSGRVEGRIADEPRGAMRSKLPYDSLFIPKGFTQTFAQMRLQKKNSISHRAQALKEAKRFLQQQI